MRERDRIVEVRVVEMGVLRGRTATVGRATAVPAPVGWTSGASRSRIVRGRITAASAFLVIGPGDRAAAGETVPQAEPRWSAVPFSGGGGIVGEAGRGGCQDAEDEV
jgi:hypothetical protein